MDQFRDTPTTLRVALLASAALVLVVAVGCGGDTGTPSTSTPSTATPSTATPSDSTEDTPSPSRAVSGTTPAQVQPLTVEEYAEWCVKEDGGWTGGGETAALEKLAADLEELDRIEPPPELRDLHNAVIRTGTVFALFLEDISEGTPPDDDEAVVWTFVFLLLGRSIERELDAVPPSARTVLVEAGCLLWAEELTAVGADATADRAAEGSAEVVEGVPEGPPA